jgi:hypothetical protein
MKATVRITVVRWLFRQGLVDQNASNPSQW